MKQEKSASVRTIFLSVPTHGLLLLSSLNGRTIHATVEDNWHDFFTDHFPEIFRIANNKLGISFHCVVFYDT